MSTVNENLLDVLAAIDDGICVIDRTYTITFMNQSMIHLFGEGVGRKCHEIINCGLRKCHFCVFQRVFQGETVRFTCDITHLDQKFEVIEVPIKSAGGSISKMVGIWKKSMECRDVDRKDPSAEIDYERLFGHVGCGVYFSTKDGKMLDANQALLDILGYKKKKDFLQIDISKDLYLDPADRGIFQERIEKEGHVTDYELVLKTSDNRPKPVSITSHVRYAQTGEVSGYEGIVVDLTHRKLMEQKLKEAYGFLDNILQSSPNAIVATDMKGNIIFWNQGAEEILGYSADNLIGKKNITSIYSEKKLRNVLKMIRSPAHGGPGKLRSYTMVLPGRDSRLIEGNLSAAILYDSEGEATAAMGLFVDLAERLKTERKLMEMQEQLFQAEKLASIGRLAAGVAHELNNPLGAIVLYSHLVLEDLPKGGEAWHNQEMVILQADRCKRIVEGLLDFARQHEPEAKMLDINHILEETLSLLENQSLFQNISVSKTLALDLPPIIGDPSQLQQVIVNLAINAAEAMERSGELTVASNLHKNFVQVRFTDNGCGLSPEDMDKIFEPFFTTKADQRGTGLGLAVSHGIVSKHGGSLSVSSKLNEGSTFLIRLPVFAELHEP